MRILPALLLFSCGFGTVFAWDADDDTFDPSIETVIVDGKTRLGDPAPFQQLGIEHRGFTHVGFQQPATGPGMIVVSLLVDLVPGESTPPGAGMFLLPADAEKLLDLLERSGVEEAEPGAVGEPIAGAMGDVWKIVVSKQEGQSYIDLERSMAGTTLTFRFTRNASRKLAGAITHSLGIALEGKETL